MKLSILMVILLTHRRWSDQVCAAERCIGWAIAHWNLHSSLANPSGTSHHRVSPVGGLAHCLLCPNTSVAGAAFRSTMPGVC